jgi:hypothetical protein
MELMKCATLRLPADAPLTPPPGFPKTSYDASAHENISFALIDFGLNITLIEYVNCDTNCAPRALQKRDTAPALL